MTEDLRAPIAKARDRWLDSAEGLRCLEDSILTFGARPYLRNRLQQAFEAGWNTSRKHTGTVLLQDMTRLLNERA